MTDYVVIDQTDTRDFGVTCTFLPPVQVASERVFKQSVPGRSDYLHIRDDSFETLSKTAGFFYEGENISAVAEMFRRASSVTFSNEPEKKYSCSVVGGFVMKNTIFNYYEFEVNFECNPEKREVSETEIEATSGMTITNIGNRKARPTFEVTGSGTIVLTVGSQTITLTAVSGTFIVDGVLQECYAGTVSKNLNMTGDFPVIEPGEECSISWTGEATILIKPNWRWV